MRRTPRPLLLLAAAVLAACGGDDEPAIDPAVDREIIEDATIGLRDLPDGFEVDASPADDDDDAEADACREAAGVDIDALDDAKVVEGDEVRFQRITDESLIGVTASINSFDDRDVALQNLEGIGTDEFIECAVEAIGGSGADGGREVGDVDAEVVDPPLRGDDRVSVRFEFETQGLPTIVEQHLVLVDRFGISLQIVGLNYDPADDDLAADLLEEMIEEIEDALD